MRHNFAKMRSKKRHSITQIFFLPPQAFLLHFYSLNFPNVKFFCKKIKFTSKQFLNFVPKSYYSVPIALKMRHFGIFCATNV